jgi:hypothetical protein
METGIQLGAKAVKPILSTKLSTESVDSEKDSL